MIRKLLSVCFLFLMSCANVHGIIFEVKDLSKFHEQVLNLGCSDLVLFDIDNTLITPKDVSLKPCGNGLRRKFLQHLDSEQKERLQSIMVLEGHEELLETEFPTIIKMLQQKNVPVMGFTALETGKYGNIECSEDWRINRLRSLGIDFTGIFRDKDFYIFKECSSYRGHFPIFKKGILFTNRLIKGDVLGMFLGKVCWKPKKLIFMDDSLDQLKSVELAANAMGIVFVGFHYVANKFSGFVLDQKLGEFQFRNLVEKEQWLQDAEAKRLMNR